MHRLTTATLLVLLFALGAGAASAAASGGALTSSEYYQLSAVQSRVKAIKTPGNTKAGASAALLACEEIQELSPLLTAERTSCADQEELVLSSLSFQVLTQHCRIFPTAVGRMNCLLPGYRAVDKAAAALYNGDVHAVQLAKSRGFTGACAEVLGSSAKVIAAERNMSRDTHELVIADSAHNVNALKQWSARLITDGAQQSAAQLLSPSKLSLCPHK